MSWEIQWLMCFDVVVANILFRTKVDNRDEENNEVPIFAFVISLVISPLLSMTLLRVLTAPISTAIPSVQTGHLGSAMAS